jgi:hypothetical protein
MNLPNRSIIVLVEETDSLSFLMDLPSLVSMLTDHVTVEIDDVEGVWSLKIWIAPYRYFLPINGNNHDSGRGRSMSV